MEYKVAEDVAWEDTPEVQLARKQYVERNEQRTRVYVVTWVGAEVVALVGTDSGARVWVAVPYQAEVEVCSE